MALYKTNTIILNAVQWDGTEQSLRDLKVLAQPHPERLRYATQNVKGVVSHPHMQIVSSAGVMNVNHYDWVIAGDLGTLFVMPDTIFKILATKV